MAGGPSSDDHRRMQAHLTDDAAEAFGAASSFLESDPVAHNLVLTLMTQRVRDPEPGRYVWVSDDSTVVGFVFQSPFTYPATATPMPPGAVTAAVAALVEVAPDLPGVTADAATAARFAGEWATRLRVPVAPAEAQRLYALQSFVPPPVPAPGAPRSASIDDAALLERFGGEFQAEIGEGHGRASAAQMLASRTMWLWEDPDPRCMVGQTVAHAGAGRIGPVYTPPQHRGCGYAAVLTAHATQALLDIGATPLLYTQLSNPTSNAVYQRLGYEPVAEITRYAFG